MTHDGLENLRAQLQHTQLELKQTRAQLRQTQLELEQSQSYVREAFQSFQREREQKLSQIRQLQFQLDQIHNEGVKGAALRFLTKLKKKGKRMVSQIRKIPSVITLKNFKTSFQKVQSKLRDRQDGLEPTLHPELLALAGINSEQFWQILRPILATSVDRVGEETPQISILTPTWNSSLDWFVETAISVFSQSIPNWEWCIVDDGSQHPDIRAVVEELARQHPRVRVRLQETSTGISAATNQALDLAQGKFICFLDHDDTLAPNAIAAFSQKIEEGFDVIYSDEDKIDSSGRCYTEPFYKPDWSPEYFRGVMYVGHLLCVRKDLAIQVGGLDQRFDGVQDYEFMLRVSETTDRIAHIPQILYHWRKIPGSIAARVDAKQGITQLQAKAVQAHLHRLNLPAEPQSIENNHRVQFLPKPRTNYPLISIIIPTKDAPEYLEKCLKSIFSITIYPNYEVILIDNETTDLTALQIMEKFPVKRIPFPNPFNFSRANNLGAKAADGDYLVLLNNDTEVITPDWLEHLLYHAEQPDVGAVGALLLYPDSTVQHAGVVMGLRGTADHIMRGFSRGIDGYAGSLICSREVSAVTAACLMLKKHDFETINGLNEHFFTHYQDVDLCLQLIKMGRRNIYTSQAVLIHHESKTRKTNYDMVDRMLLLDLHQLYIDSGDPYYNPNFDLAHFDYTVRADAC